MEEVILMETANKLDGGVSGTEVSRCPVALPQLRDRVVGMEGGQVRALACLGRLWPVCSGLGAGEMYAICGLWHRHGTAPYSPPALIYFDA